MKLPFLDRAEESRRIRRFLARRETSLAVVYGRRRCGKSRLLAEVLPPERTAYFVADDREGPLQRAALAREIGRLVDGFDQVAYPEWDSLLERWWRAAPRGAVLAIDELPSLVARAPEVPSLLQRHLDKQSAGGPHLVLAGSSQRMMHGLVLDRSAPLYGRAAEVLRIGPLPCGWIRNGLPLSSAAEAVEAWSVFGGIPRYWELAAEHPSLPAAIRDLVLSPLGALHDEPSALLLDDLRDIAQAASILVVVGQGCHRLSQIAGGLEKPATAMTRPLRRLLDLGLVRRDTPFGESSRDGKRSAYRIGDPFLRFWFRFVEPDRSRLEAGREEAVLRDVQQAFAGHVAGVWEDLVRAAVPRWEWLGRAWEPASSWWGPGLDRKPLELDVVAASEDGGAILVGEVKWAREDRPERLLDDLRRRAARLPIARGKTVEVAVWTRDGPGRAGGPGRVFGPEDVVGCLT